jgi:hypothetical protein
MTTSTEPTSGGISPPLPTAALLGAAPLIRGENPGSYEELLGRICATLRPKDCLEELWIRDVVDLVWETFRLRRLKATLMTDEASSEIGDALSKHHAEGRALADEWARGGNEAAQTLYAALASAGLSAETLTTRAVVRSYSLEKMERIDRMLVRLEARRAAALRELDTHRRPLAQKLRLAIAQEENGGAGFKPALTDAPRLASEAQPA